MAKRPIFVPVLNGYPYIRVVEVEFDWYPGLSITQAQRSVASLHASANEKGFSPILEISTKSVDPLGVSLSAFNLRLMIPQHPPMSVECAFQGSKVFRSGGPYTDLYSRSSRDAKMDPRLRESGDVVSFQFLGVEFPIFPKTAFYDWLYIRALTQNRLQAVQLMRYKAFSDIAFNPNKSFNCQARSAALYVGLTLNVDMERLASDHIYFLEVFRDISETNTSVNANGEQMNLPFSIE